MVLAVAAMQSAGVFAGSHVGGTRFLPDVGDGFLEHYAVWATLVSDPLLVIAAGLAYGLPAHLLIIQAVCMGCASLFILTRPNR